MMNQYLAMQRVPGEPSAAHPVPVLSHHKDGKNMFNNTKLTHGLREFHCIEKNNK